MKEYNQLLLEHFFHSPFVGELPDALQVTVGQGSETDRLQLHVQFTAERIAAARFKAHGNPYTVAAGSLLCELIQGKTLAEAKRITHQQLQHILEIPLTHRHSALVAEQALQTALVNYEKGMVCTI